jgi:hypothetical protein
MKRRGCMRGLLICILDELSIVFGLAGSILSNVRYYIDDTALQSVPYKAPSKTRKNLRINALV